MLLNSMTQNECMSSRKQRRCFAEAIIERLDRIEMMLSSTMPPKTYEQVTVMPPPGLQSIMEFGAPCDQPGMDPKTSGCYDSQKDLVQNLEMQVCELTERMKCLEKLLLVAPIEHFDCVGSAIEKLLQTPSKSESESTSMQPECEECPICVSSRPECCNEVDPQCKSSIAMPLRFDIGDANIDTGMQTDSWHVVDKALQTVNPTQNRKSRCNGRAVQTVSTQLAGKSSQTEPGVGSEHFVERSVQTKDEPATDYVLDAFQQMLKDGSKKAMAIVSCSFDKKLAEVRQELMSQMDQLESKRIGPMPKF